MTVVETRMVGKWLAFRLTCEGAADYIIGFGPDVLPGTDMPGYRFLGMRSTPSRSRQEYLEAQKVAREYAREHGFQSLVDYYTHERAKADNVSPS